MHSTPEPLHDQVKEWRSPSSDFDLRHTAAWFEENVEDLYSSVRFGGGPIRLGDLVRATGDHYPELLPNRAARERDAALPPSERSRIERDQALLLRALLRKPSISTLALADMRVPLPESSALASCFESAGELVLDTVSVRRVGTHADVILSETMSLNAETDQLARDLEIAVDIVTLSPTVSVGVLRGGTMAHQSYAGRRVFCAGINLKHLASGRISYLDFLIEREAGLLAKLARGVRDPATGRDLIRPWVCVVDAFAIGGGMQLTLVCDHVVAVDEAWLSLPAAREGIVPGMANLRLPSRVGIKLAREIIIHGRQLSGTEAERVGLVDAVVPAGGIASHIRSVVDTLSAPAVAANKLMLTHGSEPEYEFAAYLADFAVVQAERMHAEDVHRKLPESR